MKISVITVCFNEKETIRRTIESVTAQTFDGLEYIITDGASTDGTVDIIKEYADDPRIDYISEPDGGLYDAMNKSLARASGDYVIFMNSGDMFYDGSVLADVAPLLAGDIVYGDVLRRSSSGDYIQTYKGTRTERIRLMLCGLMFCHQTQFTRAALMKEYGFRFDYAITADFDFVVRCMSEGRSFKHIDRVICSFDNEGGISAQEANFTRMRRDVDSSIRQYFPVLYYCTIIPKRLFRLLFR
ncbi:MAG: glycosyltransferase [Lachnospiraceae bacterium]|nr:glycosyltransferase [Lachnospiraceae bacterium]